MKTGKIHFIILLLAWVMVHSWLFNHFGVRTLLYDSAGYLRASEYLMVNGKLEDVRLIFYSFPISLLALLRWIFSGEILAFIIFQCLISGAAIISLYMAGLKIFQNSLAAFCSCILFLFWFDNIQWNTVIMTESLSMSITCFLLCAIAHFNGSIKKLLLILIILVASVLTRPTGIILVVSTIAFLIAYYSMSIRNKPLLIMVLVSGILMVSYAGAHWMFSQWDFTEQYAKGNIITYADHIEGTPLFHEGMRLNNADIKLPDSNRQPIEKMVMFIFDNPVFFFKSFIFKVGYLLSFVRPYYSLIHNIFSVVWVSFIYGLSFFGWRRTEFSPTKIYVLTIIIVNSSLIGISSVDWDNRFYVPTVPGFVLLAGGGAAYLISKSTLFQKYFRKTSE